MQDWLKSFHGANAAFPALEIAVKIALTLALGLFVGFEREWSNKDIGVRTFAMTALLGLLGSVTPFPLLLFSGAAVLVLIVFANLRGLQTARKLEATTSVALAIVFLLGVLVGQGHLFTPVACSILVAMLLALNPQLRAFAGGLSPQEVRSALVLALLGFVIWPLLPDRFVDPWQLLEPREAWITVVVIACLGFANYVLLRLYGSKGVYLTAALGGLINSTASVAELTSTLSSAGLVPLTVSVVLVTSIAMFLRNVLLLAIFARAAIPTAALPLLAMSAIAAYWIYRDRGKARGIEGIVPLKLDSPISLRKVLSLGVLFIAVQIVATLGQRLVGGAGFQIASFLGGLVSSAGTTAAAASMAMHGRVTSAEAGVAVVLASIASALADLPVVYRQKQARPAFRALAISSASQVCACVMTLVLQNKAAHFF